MTDHIFNSFFMGGFECSTHRNAQGKRLDLIASTRHDEFAEQDYCRLVQHGIKTARDGVRWHLIEKEPYRYDFSSLDDQIRAIKQTGIEVIWDYFHYGYPDDIDIFSDEFPKRFSRFATALTQYLQENLKERLSICPINEISFFSWIAGEKGIFYPCKKGKGDRLKEQLVETAKTAVKAIRQECPDARMVFTDPAIHVVPRNDSPAAKRAAESYRLSQFQVFDSLVSSYDSEDPNHVDVLGLNYYFHNQWRHPSRRKIPRGHKQYRPLHEILCEFYSRYKLPLFIAETGIEDDERADWFRYVADQTHIARDAGVPIAGICLYPVVNHPGWADDRHCHNGLWDYPDDLGDREIYQPLADEITRQMQSFA